MANLVIEVLNTTGKDIAREKRTPDIIPIEIIPSPDIIPVEPGYLETF